MYYWCRDPNNGCPKGPDSLLIEHISSPMKGGSDIEETGKPRHDVNVLDESENGISGNHDTMFSEKFGDHATMAFSGEFLQTLNLKAEDKNTNEDWQLQVWGTPWTPDEFVDMSVKAGHPAKLQSFLPPILMDCIGKSLKQSCAQRMAHRAQALKYWLTEIASAQKSKKVNLWQHWNLELQKFCRVRGSLFGKRCSSQSATATWVCVDEFCAGSKLTGQTELTNLWPSKVTQATMTEGEPAFPSQAKLQRNDLSYGQVVFFDPEIAHSVWDQTLQEVARGEAEGPFDLNEVPSHFPLSRRFGVKQSGKIRCVDNFSWSGINAASQPRESPKPHTLDVVAAMISAVMCHAQGGHAWLARSFDLKSAYRQCAVHPASRQFSFSYIVVGDPNALALKVFRLKALPFGSVKSVHSFLRISHSLWAILTSIFCVITTNYFDDFVSLAESRKAASVGLHSQSSVQVAGLAVRGRWTKGTSLSATTWWRLVWSLMYQNYIMVQYRLPTLRAGETSWLDRWTQPLRSKSLTKLEALRLRGRMQFASGQFYGRLTRRCLAVVTLACLQL